MLGSGLSEHILKPDHYEYILSKLIRYFYEVT